MKKIETGGFVILIILSLAQSIILNIASNYTKDKNNTIACFQMKDEILYYAESCDIALHPTRYNICTRPITNTAEEFLACGTKLASTTCNEDLPQECSILK